MTNPKLEKYNKDRDKTAARLAVLQSRLTELDSKIMEMENIEIRALMKTESMTLTDLMDLVRSMQEKRCVSISNQTDGDYPHATDNDSDYHRFAYNKEESNEDTDDEE